METQILENNYYPITYEKELSDTIVLVQKLKSSGWLKADVNVINCFPAYSSRVSHLLSHMLSSLNRNEPFEVVNLQMPYPTMVQVWDDEDRCFKQYSSYLSDWIRRNTNLHDSYLFVGSDGSGQNYSTLRGLIKGRLDGEKYRFASIYNQKGSQFVPDFYTEQYSGKLLFQWENTNNPNSY